MKLGDWLDARTGWRGPLRRLAETRVPGGARWSYVIGGLVAFSLGVQAVTGILLASFYAPSTTTAWASVAYIQDQVTLGWLIRGLHSAGASLTVALLLAHLVQVAAWGAFRAPREVTWWLGLVLLALVLGFALTGYLLPWDQKGYWATQVATSLIGQVPLVGDFLRRLLQGGNDYGNLTLTHFYALHTMALPALLVAGVVAHITQVRRHGVANPTATQLSEPFWPRQAARDVVGMALVLAGLLVVVVRSHGAELEAPADPSSSYDARPEWYFLPLFQLLKFFSGSLETVAAIGVPLLVAGLLFALPLLRPSRKAAAGLVGLLLAGAAALGMQATLADSDSGSYRQSRARAAAEAERARALAARNGVPPAGGMAALAADPQANARALFAARCGGCHVLDGGGEARGPLLTGWSSRAWLTDFLKNPDAPRYFGRTRRLHQMKPVKPSGDELAALVEYLWAQGGGEADGAKVARGEALFRRESCDDCHASDGKAEGDGAPNLGGRGSVAWIEQVIRDAGAGAWFGDHNEMPRFGREKLAEAELAALVQLLAAERLRRDVDVATLANQ